MRRRSFLAALAAIFGVSATARAVDAGPERKTRCYSFARSGTNVVSCSAYMSNGERMEVTEYADGSLRIAPCRR